MSGPLRPDGASDELGLAEVAWRLRTTLASAGDLSAPGNDAVLSGIRRRSQKRRRAKRVMGTSMASFVLVFATLLVIKGGQVAIQHDVARQAESPAVTPGAEGAGTTTVPNGPSTTTKDHGNVVVGECPGGDRRACRSTTGPSTGPTAGPDTTVAGNPPSSSTPSTPSPPVTGAAGQSGVPSTGTQVRPPATPPVTTITYAPCPPLADDPDCLMRARSGGEPRRVLIESPDPANPSATVTRLFSASSTLSFVWVETRTATAGLLQQCTILTRVPAPEYYAVANCTPGSTVPSTSQG
jgi:hypothetical protein